MPKITENEYLLMSKYIEENCGIHLSKGKEYLIESRLVDLLEEYACDSFQQFYFKAKADTLGKLRDRIIDAMTTNETLWFRDDTTWKYIKEVAVPALLDKAERSGNVRIWSAASSTGQEAYSLLMTLDEEAKKRGKPDLLNRITIIGTDISTSALFIAISGRYDSMAVSRGLPLDKKNKYFTKDGNVWVFNQELKKRVQFQKFNLLNSLSSLGSFDMVLCRYVIIYFSDAVKKELFRKIATTLISKGILLLGASENLRGFTDAFETIYYKNGLVYIKQK
ncbi:MAG: protein-glutamate O-methyltransferase CheR [Desulfobacterales bacterium]|nr:protein-glutamate O-methyltransferase CheR [Desulfobacterales bacterium]